MSSSILPIQREAQFQYQSPFPFFLENGGLGASLDCSGTSNRTQFVGTGQTLLLHVFGAAPVYIAWGESDVVATINHLPIYPNVPGTLFTLPATTEVNKLLWFAGITDGAICRLLVHRGGGC